MNVSIERALCLVLWTAPTFAHEAAPHVHGGELGPLWLVLGVFALVVLAARACRRSERVRPMRALAGSRADGRR